MLYPFTQIKDGAIGKRAPLIVLNLACKYITADIQKWIEERGIPLSSEMPLLFSYPDVLLPCLPKDVNKERFFNNLTDLLYCYWSVLQGMRFMGEKGMPMRAFKRSWNLDAFAEQMSIQQGIPKEEVLKNVSVGLEPDIMLVKWYADSTIAKLRALWDKMLPWVAEVYFGIKPSGTTKWGSRTRGRVGDFYKQIVDQTPQSDPLKPLLEALGQMFIDISSLKELRDNDLHRVSTRVIEVFGKPGSDMDMLTLWMIIDEEVKRATEGLVACFGVILARDEAINSEGA